MAPVNETKRRRSRANSRPASAVPKSSFGDTDPELVSHPELWNGSGYGGGIYSRLGAQNSEMHGQTKHDPELIPAQGRAA